MPGDPMTSVLGPAGRAAGPSAPSAIGKALRLLSTFRSADQGVTLSALARRAGLSLTTTHRIVSELIDWGALERDVDGLITVGLRLYEIGVLAPRGHGLREAALPYMEDLYEVTHEVVQLAVREGTELVFIERLAGRRSIGVLTRVGMRFPLPASAAGLVLLAHAPFDVREAVLSKPLKPFSRRTIVDPDQVRAMLPDIRRLGFAVSSGQVSVNAVAVGAPICDASGNVVAALAVVADESGRSGRELGRLVSTTARAISRAVAAPPPRWARPVLS